MSSFLVGALRPGSYHIFLLHFGQFTSHGSSSCTRPRLDPEPSRTRPRLDPEPSRTRPRLDPEPSRTRPRLDPEPSRTRPRLDPEPSRTRPRLDPEPSRTRPRLDSFSSASLIVRICRTRRKGTRPTSPRIVCTIPGRTRGNQGID